MTNADAPSSSSTVNAIRISVASASKALEIPSRRISSGSPKSLAISRNSASAFTTGTTSVQVSVGMVGVVAIESVLFAFEAKASEKVNGGGLHGKHILRKVPCLSRRCQIDCIYIGRPSIMETEVTRPILERQMFTARVSRSVLLSPQTKHLELNVEGLDEFRFLPGSLSPSSIPAPTVRSTLARIPSRRRRARTPPLICASTAWTKAFFPTGSAICPKAQPFSSTDRTGCSRCASAHRTPSSSLPEPASRPSAASSIGSSRSRNAIAATNTGWSSEPATSTASTIATSSSVSPREPKLPLRAHAQPLRRSMDGLSRLRAGARARDRRRPHRHAVLRLWPASDGRRQSQAAQRRVGLDRKQIVFERYD